MLHNFILSINLYVLKKGIKGLYNNRPLQPVTGLVSPVSSLFSGCIPIWSGEARHVYLLAPAFKFHERERAQGGALSDIQMGAGGPT